MFLCWGSVESRVTHLFGLVKVAYDYDTTPRLSSCRNVGVWLTMKAWLVSELLEWNCGWEYEDGAGEESLNSLPSGARPGNGMMSWKCKGPTHSTRWTDGQAVQPKLGLKVLVGYLQDLELSPG